MTLRDIQQDGWTAAQVRSADGRGSARLVKARRDPRCAVPSDEELWEDFCGSGRGRPFEELMRRHWSALRQLGRRCLGDDAAGQDIAQEVFVKVATADARFERAGAFVTWLNTLAFNAVRMRVRARERRRKRELAVAVRDSPARRSEGERRIQASEVRAWVNRLPPDLRRAVELRYFEGFTHREVAQALGCPPGTASSRIRRGIARLREALPVGGGPVAPTPTLSCGRTAAAGPDRSPSLVPLAPEAASPHADAGTEEAHS